MLFVIEFLQQYAVLNLDQDTQLMLTVDYEAKSIVAAKFHCDYSSSSGLNP